MEKVQKMKKDKVRIVIVDSGVYLEHPLVKEKVKGYTIDYLDDEITVNEGCVDNYGHGTAVYGIIRQHCPEAEIIVVKIFNNSNDYADVIKLNTALEFIYENIECNIINMSVGISVIEDRERLYNICNLLRERGTVLVAAYDNYGSMSYPADFDCVLGVSEGEKCYKNSEFVYITGTNGIVLGNGHIQRVLWKEPIYQLTGGNSFACAHISGIIAHKYNEIISEYDGDVKKYLINNSIYGQHYIQNEFQIKRYCFKNIKRAVIFPFNKEMHSLIRFSKELPFEIAGIYDVRYSGRVGAYTNHLLKIDKKDNYIVKNIEELDYDEFDMIIVGHTSELERIMKIQDYSKKIISECINKEKYVYSFDNNADEHFKYSKYFFTPNLTYNNCALPLGKLYRSGKPVIGVFGTTSKQGKFTFQLYLRQELIKRGYKVSQIGTEPSSLLFGIEYCFPFGYQSNCEIARKDMVYYINNIMEEINNDDSDVVIVGCQSKTLPFDNGNIDDFTFSQVEFLFSTWPDCVFLSINIFDEFNDIRRTINFIESAINTKVLALVVFPMKLLNEEAGIYSEKIPLNNGGKNIWSNKIEQEFGLPVYFLGEKMNEIGDRIVDFFE